MKYFLAFLVSFFCCVLLSSNAQADVRVKIKKGETLWSLAEKHYGKGQLYVKIAKANKIKDPRRIKAGSWITIPSPGVASSKQSSVIAGNINEAAVFAEKSISGTKEGKHQETVAAAASLPQIDVQSEGSDGEGFAVAAIAASLSADRQETKIAEIQPQGESAQKDGAADLRSEIAGQPDAAVSRKEGWLQKTSPEASSKKWNWELGIKGFYGCTDILSECRGGEAQADVYREDPGGKGHSFGINLKAFGAYGKIVEERYVWHKISGGGGPSYKFAWDNKQVKLESSLLVQSLKSNVYGFNKKQKDLLLMQTAEYLHKQGSWLWGISLTGKLPLATSFSSDMPSFLGDHRTSQAAAEAIFLLQHDLTDSLKLKWSFSPYNYQGQENTTGIKASLELRIKERVSLEAGVLAYPYGVPNKLSDYGVKSSDLTGGFFGIKMEFGADKLRGVR